MLLSRGERSKDSARFLVVGVVAEHGPDNVDASAVEGKKGLFVVLALASFPVVEDP